MSTATSTADQPAGTAQDPVCGMTVKLGAGKPSYRYRSRD
jgi:hypothetical protein